MILYSLGTLCNPSSPTAILAEFLAPSGAFWSQVLELQQGTPKFRSSGMLVEGSIAWSVGVPEGCRYSGVCHSCLELLLACFPGSRDAPMGGGQGSPDHHPL